MADTGLDIDRLRADLFLHMVRTKREDLAKLTSEEAQLRGEHAARLAKAALDGMGYFDRTGRIRDPRPTTALPPTP